MLTGVQKIYGPLAGLVVSLVSMALLGSAGPTEEEIAAVNVAVNELVSLGIGTAVAVAVTYIRNNINVNGILQRFVDRQGNVQDASGKIIGKIEAGDTVANKVVRSPAWIGALAIGALALSGCDALRGFGVSDNTQAMCSEMMISALNDEAVDVDLVNRLKASGLMCLAVVVDDVMTVDAVPAQAESLEGELVAGDAEAAAALD